MAANIKVTALEHEYNPSGEKSLWEINVKALFWGLTKYWQADSEGEAVIIAKMLSFP